MRQTHARLALGGGSAIDLGVLLLLMMVNRRQLQYVRTNKEEALGVMMGPKFGTHFCRV